MHVIVLYYMMCVSSKYLSTLVLVVTWCKLNQMDVKYCYVLEIRCRRLKVTFSCEHVEYSKCALT